MGQMIRITYVGAFIVPEFQKFKKVSKEDDFYEEFYEKGHFINPYQGLESIDVLIPANTGFSIQDYRTQNSEFVIDKFSNLKYLEENLKESYKEIILRLKELYPEGNFEVKSGIICYFDEIA